MISVLIPVYNTDITELAGELSKQLAVLDVPGEIVIADDASGPAWRSSNRAVAALPGVRYVELEQNQGRVAIRNRLAALARYNHFIFVDGDSRVLTADFLRRYTDTLPTDAVVAGGRVYGPEAPTDCAYHLHWKYGSLRESVATARAFHSNNFLISRHQFNQICFPGWPNSYGHEDTWMGIELERLGVPVIPIHNPVLHLQLEPCAVFLDKTDAAVRNLYFLHEQVAPEVLGRHVRLYRAARLLVRFRLQGLLLRMFPGDGLRSKLTACNPSLRLFDLYRLTVLLRLLAGGR